jgi:ADP-ribose pyrophosphatase YjhB (NUDIX family)
MVGRDSHCSYCGTRFQSHVWPRTCARCRNVSYRNPLPVAVGLVPIGAGLLVIQRAAPPGADGYALPGGFVEWGESWQEAIARELREETGVVIDALSVREHLVRTTRDGKLLVFGITEAVEEAKLPIFEPNPEVSERSIITGPIELAFPLHTEAARAYFEAR